MVRRFHNLGTKLEILPTSSSGSKGSNSAGKDLTGVPGRDDVEKPARKRSLGPRGIVYPVLKNSNESKRFLGMSLGEIA